MREKKLKVEHEALDAGLSKFIFVLIPVGRSLYKHKVSSPTCCAGIHPLSS